MSKYANLKSFDYQNVKTLRDTQDNIKGGRITLEETLSKFEKHLSEINFDSIFRNQKEKMFRFQTILMNKKHSLKSTKENYDNNATQLTLLKTKIQAITHSLQDQKKYIESKKF